MTYERLAELIASWTPEQRRMDVTVYLSDIDEFVPVDYVIHPPESDVLDAGHPVLRLVEDDCACCGKCEKCHD